MAFKLVGEKSKYWPSLSGEAAECIRAHDWAATPLGAVESWPQSLRTVVDLMLCAKQPVYIAFGPALTSLYNDGYIPILGTKHPKALGKPYSQVWPEIWDQSIPLIEAIKAGEAQHFVDHPVPLAGRLGRPMSWFTFSWTPLRDEAGAVSGFYCWAIETTDHVLAQAQLRKNELRHRQLVEQMTDGLFVANAEGRYIDVNPVGCAMLGMTFDEILGKTISDVTVPEDHCRIGPEVARFDDGGVHSSEWRFRRKDGSVFIGEVTGRKLPNGSLQGMLRDITERKRHEEQLRLLIREVNHRAKNMLSIVQAVARQTVAASPEDFVERFGERIQALAASQDLLVKSGWKGVELAELLRAQLLHFNDLIGTRIELQGPSLVISAYAAQTLGMAAHELAANAGKYGALSNGEGRVLVQWAVRAADAHKTIFEISWTEHGGPSITKPSRMGFGSTVISEMAQMSLNSEVELDFAASGLTWRLRCAAAELLEAGRPVGPSKVAPKSGTGQ